jgi:hypothetical protein
MIRVLAKLAKQELLAGDVDALTDRKQHREYPRSSFNSVLLAGLFPLDPCGERQAVQALVVETKNGRDSVRQCLNPQKPQSYC